MEAKEALDRNKYHESAVLEARKLIKGIDKFLKEYGLKAEKGNKEFSEVEKLLASDKASVPEIQVKLANLVDSLQATEDEKKKIKYKASYITGIPLLKPKSVSIDTAERCNLQCRICSQWKDKNEHQKITFEDMKKIIDDLHNWCPEVILEFSGQEPLLKKEFLMKSLAYGSKKISLALSTNGILLDEKTAKELLGFNIHHISISLDGANSKTHDYIRGMNGAFEKTVRGIRNLVEIKRHDKSIKTAIAITCVITDKNVNELVQIYQLAKEIGVDCINYNAYTLDNSYFFNEDATYDKDEFWVKPEKIHALREAISQLITLKSKGSSPIISNDASQLEKIPAYFEKRGNFGKETCLAGYNYFHITNFGELTVCGKGPGLNIRDHSLKDIWNSANFWGTRMKTGACQKPCLNNCFELI